MFNYRWICPSGKEKGYAIDDLLFFLLVGGASRHPTCLDIFMQHAERWTQYEEWPPCIGDLAIDWAQAYDPFGFAQDRFTIDYLISSLRPLCPLWLNNGRRLTETLPLTIYDLLLIILGNFRPKALVVQTKNRKFEIFFYSILNKELRSKQRLQFCVFSHHTRRSG